MEYFQNQNKFSKAIYSVKQSVISIFIPGVNRTIQIINTNQKSILGILTNFDATLSQCSFQRGEILCTSKFLTTMKTRNCEVLKSISIHRLAKIYNRKFSVIVDTTKNNLISHLSPPELKLSKNKNDPQLTMNAFFICDHPTTIRHNSHYYHPKIDDTLGKHFYEIKLHFPRTYVSMIIKPVIDMLKPWDPNSDWNYEDDTDEICITLEHKD